MKVNCLFLFVLALASACQTSNSKDQANPVHDLLIDRVFWKPHSKPGSVDSLVNQHKFTITNTSGQHSYSQIQVRFNYYDANYHRIDSAKYVVSQSLEPRSAITINDVQVGKVNPATKSSTVTVEQAESN